MKYFPFFEIRKKNKNIQGKSFFYKFKNIWNCPRGSRNNDFSNLSMFFRNFVIISPWKKEGPFIYTNLNPHHPKMIYAKFGWNCPSGFGEKDLKNLSMYFRYFLIISPWKRAWSFIWKNLNPFQPRMLCAKYAKRRRRQWQRQRRRRITDKFWSGKLARAFDSGELKSCLRCGLWDAVQDWLRCPILVYKSRRILMLAQCYSNDDKQTSLNLASLDIGPMLFNQRNKTIFISKYWFMPNVGPK